MKKFPFLFLVILEIVTAIVISPRDIAFAATQSERTQNEDLCGSTSGNGQIVSVGNDAFTLKLNEGGPKGGGNLTVELTDQATIEASAGFISFSELKIGDRVTLVGDNNRDGTFTAKAVVVCSGVQAANAPKDGPGQVASIAVRNKNSEGYEKVNGIINTATVLLVVLIWLGILAFLRLNKKKSLVYLLFFTIFYVYLYKILDYTLLQFQTLLLLQHFVPGLMLNGFKDGTNVNLIPIATLTLDDVKTSFLNILMMIPFGFGLPFIASYRMKKVVTIGLLLSITIELLQFITGLMANTSFRVADVNDLIFNTIGVAIGYILFVAFVRGYRHLFHNWKRSNSFLRFIGERPQIDKPTL